MLRRREGWTSSVLASIVAASLGVAWIYLDRVEPWAPTPSPSPLASVACLEEGLWSDEDGRPYVPGERRVMTSGASLHACAAGPGVLTVEVRGSLAGGTGSRAVLMHGEDRLLDLELRDETMALEVDVPSAGMMLLAFVNDYYDPPEDRNLWITELAFAPLQR